MILFKCKANNTRIYIEIISGITTFLSMAYLLVAAPTLISQGDSRLYMPVFVATCIASFTGTMFMALFANLPFVVAPGMALTSLFAVTVIGEWGYSYPEALAIVFIASILYTAIVALGFKPLISKALPSPVKSAIIAGLGLLLAFTGLKNAGLLVSDANNLVGFGGLSGIFSSGDEFMSSLATLLAVGGVMLIAILYRFKVPGSIFIGVAATGVGYWLLGSRYGQVAIPAVGGIDWQEAGNSLADWAGSNLCVCFTKGMAQLFSGANSVPTIMSIVIVIVCFSLNELFNGVSVMLAAGEQAGLVDDNGSVRNMRQGLLADSISGVIGAMLGVPAGVVVESGSATYTKAKTGITSFVTALLLLGALIGAPYMAFVNEQVVAPALIFVGVLMLGAVGKVNFGDVSDAVPAVITLAVIPFTNSVVTGIAFGLVAHVVLKLLTLKLKDISIPETILTVFLALYLFIW